MEEKISDFPKEGFARLIRSFENTEDIVKLTRAFGLATKIHMGQHFNKGEQYINHPLRVATILVEELQVRDTDVICAALLHDAASVSQEEMQECGDRVYSIARAGMEPNQPDGKEKALEDFYSKMARASKEARCVKIADKLDSVRSMRGQAIKAAKYKEEMEKYVVPLANATDDKLAFKLSVALYELK